MRIITNSEQETFDFGRNLASELKGGEVFLLQGNLGAGKSVLVRGVASGLGITKQITSPTFVIMKVYDVFNHATIKKLVHIDAYRLTSGQDLEDIGVTEYLKKKNTVTVIEWADRVQDIWPKDVIRIDFKVVGEDKREIKITKRITHNM